ncbi:MAG: TonB C-terminal domain-containing protein [Woeseiaceae bacterium]|nr:TonB C-terminal domain-containing protein [Woeseiaceae bacterium]
MASSPNNFIPISMAVILHAMLLSSMIIAFDFARPVPITPMAIQATLVTEIPKAAPPVVKKKPEPKPVVEVPKPEPEVEVPKPDNSEELKRQAEEEKRVQDTLIEKERLEKMRQQKEADLRKKEREDALRKKEEEARKERDRQEAERKRQENEERQRQENERIRKELEAEQRVQEIQDEETRLAANSSPAMAAYKFAIAQKIRRNWSVPASASADTVCTVSVRQIPSGEITGVDILSCNGDDAVKRSVEAAIRRSSPLPEPSDPKLFNPILTLNLSPEQQN